MKKPRKIGSVEGEGSYTAARAYDAAATKDANAGGSAAAGERASQALDGPEGESLRAADRMGRAGPARPSARTSAKPRLHTSHR